MVLTDGSLTSLNSHTVPIVIVFTKYDQIVSIEIDKMPWQSYPNESAMFGKALENVDAPFVTSYIDYVRERMRKVSTQRVSGASTYL